MSQRNIAVPTAAQDEAYPINEVLDHRKKDVYQDFGIPAYWIVEPSWDRPELTVFELRSGAYEQIAHVMGEEEYRAAVPFPVTIAPSQLVTAG